MFYAPTCVPSISKFDSVQLVYLPFPINSKALQCLSFSATLETLCLISGYNMMV